MNRQKVTPTWTYDGCDEVRVVRKIDKHRFVSIEAKSVSGTVLFSGQYELCSGCQRRLLENNPQPQLSGTAPRTALPRI